MSSLLLDEEDLAEGVGCTGGCSSPAAVFSGEVFESGDVAIGVVEQRLQVRVVGGVGRGAGLPFEAVAGAVGPVELGGVERWHRVEDVLLAVGEPVELVVVELVEGAGQVAVDVVLCVVVGDAGVGP